MKLKNWEIYGTRDALTKLIGMKLPVKASWQVSKLVQVLNPELAVIDEERNKLVKEYGEGEGNKVTVKQDSENWQKFLDEVGELMQQEIDIEFTKVRIPEKIAATCDACKHNMDKLLELEPSMLMALDKFVEIT